MRTFRGGLLIGLAVAVAVAAAAITYERYDTRTLKRTIRRGEVLCGVNKGLPGFSIPDDKGDWTGFDVDFCRAVAAAIFDDPKMGTLAVPVDAISFSGAFDGDVSTYSLSTERLETCNNVPMLSLALCERAAR